ncbi:MAG: hypothetical protein SGPRY_010075 [Prymnesium sp.]
MVVMNSPIVAVPYAGSATPAVVVDGLLEDDITWSALKASEGEAFEETRERLLRHLMKTHLSILLPSLSARGSCLAGLHAISFENDFFVKPEYGEELFKLTRTCCLAGARNVLEWQSGGHVYAFLARSQLQTRAIHAALSALSKTPDGSSLS